MRVGRVVLRVGVLLAAGASLAAQDTKAEPFWMGRVVADHPEGNVTRRGVVIPLAQDAGVVFDTELLRVAAGWIGTPPQRKEAPGGADHVWHIPRDIQVFGTGPRPGAWRGTEGPLEARDARLELRLREHAMEPEEFRGRYDALTAAMAEAVRADERMAFEDPRPDHRGRLPAGFGRFEGVYVVEGRVVLAYIVQGCRILESWSLVEDAETRVLRREVQSLRLRFPRRPAVRVLIAEEPGAETLAVSLPSRNPKVTGPTRCFARPGIDDRVLAVSSGKLGIEGRILSRIEHRETIEYWRGPLRDLQEWKDHRVPGPVDPWKALTAPRPPSLAECIEGREPAWRPNEEANEKR
jgi:hypothetical protein